MPGLVVCSGYAHKPRLIIAPLTLMTRLVRPHRGSLVSTPVPRCGWTALMLGAWTTPVLLGGPRDKSTCLRARRASSRQQLPNWNKDERCRGSVILSKPVSPCSALCVLLTLCFDLKHRVRQDVEQPVISIHAWRVLITKISGSGADLRWRKDGNGTLVVA